MSNPKKEVPEVVLEEKGTGEVVPKVTGPDQVWRGTTTWPSLS